MYKLQEQNMSKYGKSQEVTDSYIEGVSYSPDKHEE